MGEYTWYRVYKENGDSNFTNQRTSSHLNVDDLRAAAHLVIDLDATFNPFGALGFHGVALLLGYPNVTDLQYNITAEDAQRLKMLAGPHGKTLFAVWKVRKVGEQ